jgi:hypothetical protein
MIARFDLEFWGDSDVNVKMVAERVTVKPQRRAAGMTKA